MARSGFVSAIPAIVFKGSAAMGVPLLQLML